MAQHRGPRRQVDADAQRVRDGVLAHRREQLRQLRRELRKIEVTVGIDEHGMGYRQSGCRARKRPPESRDLRGSLTGAGQSDH